MRVFAPTLGQDTGGQGYRIKQAFDRLDPSFEFRSMATKQSYIAYPRDMTPDLAVMQREYDAADVIHQRNNLSAYAYLDHDQGKPTVVHHQGTAYRTQPHYLDAVCRAIGALQCVSTIDLEVIHGHPWLPPPFDLEWIAERGRQARADRKDDGVIVISHAPTNRAIKSTNAVMRAVRRLADHGYPVLFDLIEGKPWQECLDRKARSDIYVDQVVLGYGNNAIEAWTMGVPVVAGVVDPRVSRRMVETIGHLPFWPATEQNLFEQLRTLVVSSSAREQAAGRGIEYARAFHDGRRTVEVLRDLWTSARPTAGSGAMAAAEEAALHPKRTGKMATFRTQVYPALMVRIGDRKFKFIGGKLHVDESEAPMIDEFSARRPEYHIVREDPVPVPEVVAVSEVSVDEGPTTSQLKKILREMGLPMWGSKATMQARIDEAEAAAVQFEPDEGAE